MNFFSQNFNRTNLQNEFEFLVNAFKK